MGCTKTKTDDCLNSVCRDYDKCRPDLAAALTPSASLAGSIAPGFLNSAQFAFAVNWFADPERTPAVITFDAGPMQDMAVAYEAATCAD